MRVSRSRLRSLASVGLRVLVSLGLLWWVISGIGLESVLSELSGIAPRYILIAIGLDILGVAISTWKWQLLLGIKGLEYPFVALWRYYYIGQFFSAFLPTVVGGDTARMYYTHRDLDAGAESVSSVFVERVTGLFAVFLVGGLATLAGLSFVPRRIAATVLVASVAGSVFLVGVFFTDRLHPVFERTVFRIETADIGSRTRRIYDSIYGYRHAPRALAGVFALSLCFRLVLVASNYAVAVGLGMDVPVIYFLVFVPLAELVLFLPVSIQGFGVREVSYRYLFTAVGASASTALALGFVMQLVLKVFDNVLGGVVYVAYLLRD